MRLGIISDTHRDCYYLNKAIEKLEKADYIFHLGDNIPDAVYLEERLKKKVYKVKGNCDFSYETPIEIFEEIEGIKIFASHGHKYYVKYGYDNILERGISLGADIILYGHTHISSVRYEDGIWIVNPGSPSMPRDSFNSIAIININGKDISPNILEL
jgi:phosphoesterase, MJ0936 family